LFAKYHVLHGPKTVLSMEAKFLKLYHHQIRAQAQILYYKLFSIMWITFMRVAIFESLANLHGLRFYDLNLRNEH